MESPEERLDRLDDAIMEIRRRVDFIYSMVAAVLLLGACLVALQLWEKFA